MLGLLLLHRNEVVSTDRLIEELWGADPPRTALNILYVYVSDLRKALTAGMSPAAAKKVLVSHRHGYSLRVEPHEIDIYSFEQLARGGRAALGADDPATAASMLRQALALWRGPPLADLASQLPPQPELARLDEEFLVTTEDRIAADLALGQHAEVVGELEELVVKHPLRERFRAQLMLALYRCGRQAEALGLYRRTRTDFVENLGIEPSPELRRLQKAILVQDPALSPAAAGAAGGGSSPTVRSRRIVTVLYADLEIATTAGKEVDAEVRSDLVSTARSTLSEAVKRHGGTVEISPGEDFLAVYGLPRVHEDDALRAVRAAAAGRRAVATLNATFASHRGLRVRVRIGLATGDVATSALSPLAGDPVTRARRLVQDACAEAVVLDDGTKTRVSHAVRIEPVRVRVAGAEAVTWLLADVKENEPAFTLRTDSPMVGRDRELARLCEAFQESVCDSTPSLVTVVGEAGIGKSRLVHELRVLLADEATILTGRCLSYGEGITFWPLGEIVSQLEAEGPRVAELVAGERHAQLIVERIRGALGSAGSSGDTEETFWAVRKVLEAVARRGPLMIVLEDVHWAEPTLLDLVDHVVASARGVPLLVICVARPELAELRPEWRIGRGNPQTIRLGPLTRREALALVGHLEKEAAPDERLRTRVVEAAGGNPLFVEQMLALHAHSAQRFDGTWVPPTIQSLLAAQIDQLPAEERRVVEQASVAGKDFSRAALHELLVEQPPVAVDARLQALVRKDFIQSGAARRGSEETFSFRHELIREAAYESLLKCDRAASHERFAVWMERAKGTPTRDYTEIIGYHLEQAYLYRKELAPIDEAARSLGERAAAYLGESGRRAYNRGDLPAAVKLLLRAASLVGSRSEVAAELLTDLGDALIDIGEIRRSEAVLDQAMETAVAAGNQALAWRARAVRLRGGVRFDPAIPASQIVSVGRRALGALADSEDDRGLADAWALLAWVPWLRCCASEAEVPVQHALDHARRAGTRRVEARALYYLLGAWLFGPLPVSEAAARCHRLLQDSRDHKRVEACCYRTLAVLRAMEGRFAEARRMIALDRAILEDLDWPFSSAAATEGIGRVELLAGRPVDAERELRRGYETLERMGEAAALATLAALLARALYVRGKYSEALRFSEVSRDAAAEHDVSVQIQWRGTLAKVVARRRRIRRAEELAREAVVMAEETDWLSQHADALMDLADVHRLAGNYADAANATGEAVRLYERKQDVVSAAGAHAFLCALSGTRDLKRRAVVGYKL